MDAIHYVGFDVHKKSVSFCVKRDDSGMVAEVCLPAMPFPQMDVWSRRRVDPRRRSLLGRK